MARYRRINIDGKSLYQTETRRTAAALLPGTAVVINSSDLFAQQSTNSVGRMYILDVAKEQGLGITDAIPSGDSAVGNMIEEGRELAVLCVAGTYKKDTPIKLGASGQFAVAVEGTDVVIGYSQDDYVIANATTDFIRVRFRRGNVVAA